MDDRTFDNLSRAYARGVSRRSVLAGLAAAALSGFGLRRASAQSSDATGSPCNVLGNPDAVCPAGFECVENLEDDCDPATGGADCPGVCQPVAPAAPTPCGSTVCGEGEFCCNESCGICAPVGGVCTQEFCGQACGPNVCGDGEFCCNESCGICTPSGATCVQDVCGEACGEVVCGATEYCCNASCSICAPFGGLCTQEFCGEQCSADGEGCLTGPAGCCEGLVCNAEDPNAGVCVPPAPVPTPAPEQPAPAPAPAPTVTADRPAPAPAPAPPTGTTQAPVSSGTDTSNVAIQRLPSTGAGDAASRTAAAWRTPLVLMSGAAAVVAARFGLGARHEEAAPIDPSRID